MIIKAVTLFLIAIGVLGMFGKLRFKPLDRLRISARKCPECGAPKAGPGACPCQRKG